MSLRNKMCRCSTRHGPSWSRPDKMFSAVDYGRDLNVTHLTIRLRRHCIPVSQKHLSHHSTAGDSRSPPPLAAPSPAATWPRGHVTCTSVSTDPYLEPHTIPPASDGSGLLRGARDGPSFQLPFCTLSVAPAAAIADASACYSCRPLTEVCA